MTNLEKAKKIIKKFKIANCGIFDSRNFMGDRMVNVYRDDQIEVNVCYEYKYLEVFGLTDEEFVELAEYYKNLIK